ncbi:MAG: ABC transporter substrate-binding protein [Coriobacteriales bacterium]|nr:ABC transporter substrate-binding protein [Coriobacteriales bacterium]
MGTMSRRTLLGSVGVAATTAALSACTGQGGATDKGSVAADQPQKLTFCLDYTPNTNHTGIYVAQEKGYFAEEGIELQIVQPAEDTAEAIIATGKAQLGVSFQDYIANVLAAGGKGIVAIAAILQHNTSGIMSRGGEGITRPAAMENHRYATWDLPVEQATIRHIVQKDGGDYDKVKLVPYSVEDEVAGLQANMYDCVWVYEGWAVQNANVQNMAVDYFSFISIDEVFDYYTPVIAANVDYAQGNPDVVKAFLRAAKKGYEFAIAQPQEAADILCKAVPELNEKLVAQSQAFLSEQYQADAKTWGVIEKDRWARFYTWLNDNKLVESALDVDAGWTMEYLA